MKRKIEIKTIGGSVPPKGTLDVNIEGSHEGCPIIARQVVKIKPKVHLFGDIHEAYGTVEKCGTRYVNCSVLSQSYNLSNKPVVITL